MTQRRERMSCYKCYNCWHVIPIRAKSFNSLQSYVKTIRVETWKQQKWFWSDIIACWIPDWPLQD